MHICIRMFIIEQAGISLVCGFENFIGGVMHVRGGPARIEKGARIAQFIFVEAETVRLYDGEYSVV